MPLWIVYHPSTTFTTPSSKQFLSESITKIYTNLGLPAFYVVVNFIPVDPANTYTGGELGSYGQTGKPFIRFVVDHIANRIPNDDARYASATDAFDRALKPHVLDQGWDWEYHVTETERRLWKINGFAPPPYGSEGERVWREGNLPVSL